MFLHLSSSKKQLGFTVISAPTLRNITIDLSMFYWPNLVSNDKKSSTVKGFCQTRLYVYQFR